MAKKKLIAGLSGMVVALLAVAITVAVFSGDPVSVAPNPGDAPEKIGVETMESTQGAELVEIKWKTRKTEEASKKAPDKDSGDEKQVGEEQPEGETD